MLKLLPQFDQRIGPGQSFLFCLCFPSRHFPFRWFYHQNPPEHLLHSTEYESIGANIKALERLNGGDAQEDFDDKTNEMESDEKGSKDNTDDEPSGPVLDKSKDKNSVLAARFVRSCPRERPRSKNQRLDKVQDSWREKVQHCTTKNLRNNILELCIESRFLQENKLKLTRNCEEIIIYE